MGCYFSKESETNTVPGCLPDLENLETVKKKLADTLSAHYELILF